MTGPRAAGGLARIQLEEIHPNPANPRQYVGDVSELADSIRERGLIQPLVVHPRTRGGYELLSGHRRYAALVHLDAATALCLIAPARKDVEALQIMLVENGQREALSPMEEARAFDRLLKMGLSQAQIARGVGRSQTHVSHRLGLMHLTPRQQAEVDAGELRVVDAVHASRAARGRADDTHFTGWHLGKHHPLAEDVRDACATAGHPRVRRVGGVGCGACWEVAIRADERRHARGGAA